jgi:hypothetical protein
MKKILRRSERGATLLETALVLPMLILLVIGLAEVAMLVIDEMAVSNAAREGARVGSAAGQYTQGSIDADTLILRSVEQAACHIEHGQLLSVTIYEADAAGNLPADTSKINRYEPSGNLNCNSVGTTSLSCRNGCPWVPASRNNNLPTPANLGVLVEYEHNPVTGLFPFPSTLTLSDRAVMRIEPNTRG